MSKALFNLKGLLMLFFLLKLGFVYYPTSPDGTKENYTYDYVSGKSKVINSNGFTNYQDINNRPVKTTFDNTTLTTDYDTLSRVSSVEIKTGSNLYTTSYGYVTTGITNKTTSLISSIKNGFDAMLNYFYDQI